MKKKSVFCFLSVFIILFSISSRIVAGSFGNADCSVSVCYFIWTSGAKSGEVPLWLMSITSGVTTITRSQV